MPYPFSRVFQRVVGRLAVLVLLLSLAACASAPLSYKIRPGASTAELSFLTDREPRYGGAVIYQYGADCREPLPTNVRERYVIHANEVATFMMGGEGDNAKGQRMECGLHVTFTPAPNAKYLASYEFNEDDCSIVLVRLSEVPGGRPEPVDAVIREVRRPLFQSGSFCEPVGIE